MKPFYMIWTSKSGTTRVKHDDYKSALTEAKRLAATIHDTEFIILKAHASIVQNKISITEFQQNEQ